MNLKKVGVGQMKVRVEVSDGAHVRAGALSQDDAVDALMNGAKVLMGGAI